VTVWAGYYPDPGTDPVGGNCLGNLVAARDVAVAAVATSVAAVEAADGTQEVEVEEAAAGGKQVRYTPVALARAAAGYRGCKQQNARSRERGFAAPQA
jgi:hypothetical protein